MGGLVEEQVRGERTTEVEVFLGDALKGQVDRAHRSEEALHDIAAQLSSLGRVGLTDLQRPLLHLVLQPQPRVGQAREELLQRGHLHAGVGPRLSRAPQIQEESSAHPFRDALRAEDLSDLLLDDGATDRGELQCGAQKRGAARIDRDLRASVQNTQLASATCGDPILQGAPPGR